MDFERSVPAEAVYEGGAPEFECFTLTLNDYDQCYEATDIHNAKTSLLKSKIDSLKYLKINTESVIIALKNQEFLDTPEILNEANAQLADLEKQIQQYESKLNEICQLRDKFKEKLTLLDFGHNDHFDAEEAVLSCQYFDPHPHQM